MKKVTFKIQPEQKTLWSHSYLYGTREVAHANFIANYSLSRGLDTLIPKDMDEDSFKNSQYFKDMIEQQKLNLNKAQTKEAAMDIKDCPNNLSLNITFNKQQEISLNYSFQPLYFRFGIKDTQRVQSFLEVGTDQGEFASAIYSLGKMPTVIIDKVEKK